MASKAVALIAGGAGGVGVACARAFADEYRLFLTDLDEERLSVAATALAADGADVFYKAADITDPTVVGALAGTVGGTLGVVVAAAGLSPSMADPWRIVEVNLVGTVRLLEGLLPIAHSGSVAVAIASIAGHRRGIARFDRLLIDPLAPDLRVRLDAEVGLAHHPGRAYAVSKRGVLLYVERAAHRWGKQGARLVSVSPGLLADTSMGLLESERGGSGLAEAAALGRLSRAEEIAAATRLLASDAASAVTGCDLVVDCGSQAGLRWHAGDDVAASWDDPDY